MNAPHAVRLDGGDLTRGGARRHQRVPGRDLPPAIPAGEVALAASGLGFQADGRWLVRDVTLDLVAGRMLAVIGPNGAGKSTLLALLAGDLTPTTGTVRIGAVPLRGAHPLAVARRRAVLPQRPSVSFPFTVTDIVEMGRSPWTGTPRDADDDGVVAGTMAATGIRDLAARRFPTLSGGEQAQTSFARVLAQQTGVLLLDEPTAALDLRHQEQIMRLAAGAAATGAAVLVVVHDIQLAAAYADEIAVLRAGRLVASGAPAEVLTESLLTDVYRLPVSVVHHPDHGLLVVPRRDRKGVA